MFKLLNSIPPLFFILAMFITALLTTPETFINIVIVTTIYFIFIRKEYMDSHTNSDSYGNDIKWEYIDDQL